MKPIKSKLLATTTAAAFALSPMMAFANDVQLEAQIETELEQMGFEIADDAMFTVEENAQIRSILAGSENENEQTRQIEQILDARGSLAITNGVQDADTVVASELRTYGYDVDPANLTAEQTAELKGIMESEESMAAKRSEIEVVLGDTEYEGIEIDFEPQVEAGLATMLKSELADMGVEVDVDTLSPAQMAEIKAVLESEDSSSDKERAITSIING